MSFEFPRSMTRVAVGSAVLSVVLLQGCNWRSEWRWPEINVPGVSDAAYTEDVSTDASRPESALESKPELTSRHMEALNPAD